MVYSQQQLTTNSTFGSSVLFDVYCLINIMRNQAQAEMSWAFLFVVGGYNCTRH